MASISSGIPSKPPTDPACSTSCGRLHATAPGALLTMPVGAVGDPGDLGLYAKLADTLDRLSIMSYGMAGRWLRLR